MGERSVEESVREWLSREGYIFELSVARALYDTAQFTIQQSDYYFDPVSETAREIDVVASHVKQDDSSGVFGAVTLAVECKATSQPWVLFTAESSLGNRSFIVQQVGNYAGRRGLHELVEDDEVQALPLFSLPQRLGYGIRCMTEKKDVAYAATMSAANAAVALAAEAKGPATRHVVLPIVAVDSPLCECYLPSGSNEPVIAQIDRGVIGWKNPVGKSDHTIVYIVTSAAVDDFARDAGNTAAELATRLASARWEEDSS